MDELEFAQQFRPDGPVTVEQVLARQRVPDRAEVEQEMAERAARAEAEERRESLRLANALQGDPLGNLSRAQSAFAAARDVVVDLEAKLADAREVLSRARSVVQEWGAASDAVLFAKRSVTPDLLAEAKRAAAEVRVEAMLEAARNQPSKECSGPDCPVCSAARASEAAR